MNKEEMFKNLSDKDKKEVLSLMSFMKKFKEQGKKHGFMKSYPIFFIKNYSAQTLKANMRIVGAMEYAVVLYRDKLPKFRNEKKQDGSGTMVFNWFEWARDLIEDNIPKIHPTQKPVRVLKQLIEIFTDEGDIVIDPVAGSGTTCVASKELNRRYIGFEIDKEYFDIAKNRLNGITANGQMSIFTDVEQLEQESLF